MAPLAATLILLVAGAAALPVLPDGVLSANPQNAVKTIADVAQEAVKPPQQDAVKAIDPLQEAITAIDATHEAAVKTVKVRQAYDETSDPASRDFMDNSLECVPFCIRQYKI